MGRVIVGLDGSRNAVAALRAAMDEARWRNADLEALYVYRPSRLVERQPLASIAATWPGVDSQPDIADMIREEHDRDERETREHAEGLLQQYVRHVGLDPNDVERTAVGDPNPARVLTHRAANAELLVVGARGQGGFAGLLIGSVAQQCVHHARCPVLVVPSRKEAHDT